MKTLIVLAIAGMAFSCAEQGNEGAKISGKAENLTDGMFVLGGPGGARDTVKLDDKGNFTITLEELEKPGNYYILSKKDYAPFYVAPGVDMKITFDKNDFKNSLKFSGKGSDINNYLVEKSKVEGDNYDWFTLEAGDFRVKQDSILAVHKGLFNSAVKDDPKDAFWAREEAEILFGWAGNMDMFESYHGYYGQVPGYKVPEGFYSYKKELDINKPQYAKSQAFFAYISQLVRTETALRVDKLHQADSTKPTDSEKIGLEVATELITDPVVLNQYLFNMATEGMQWKELSSVQATIDLFREKCKDAEMKEEFDETYNAWKKLEKGEPAIEFAGKDMQGKTVKLSDFRGKYVYVDVWATWCGPCIGEIPYLDSLETDYEGKNIVFISFSIDEDHDAWMKFVPEKKLKGVQIIGEKAWESKLCLDYKIRGVPTFMFFDPEGKIISVKMTRPSDKKTRKAFDAAF